MTPGLQQPPPPPWTLGVELGFSTSAGATLAASGTEPAELVAFPPEAHPRCPSGVVLHEGMAPVAGWEALSQAVIAPECYEPEPLRLSGMGAVPLGGRRVEPAELLAALVSLIASNARRRRGGSPPAGVAIAHPSAWGAARVEDLAQAARRASLPEVELVPIAVAIAAACRPGALPGELVAMLDFGTSSLEAAVLRRTPESFVLAGPPAYADAGGADLDWSLLGLVGQASRDKDAQVWERLVAPRDAGWRHLAGELRREVRWAREALAVANESSLRVPRLELTYQVTRSELDEVAVPVLKLAVDALGRALAGAGIAASDLSSLLVSGDGGSLELVGDAVWRRTGVSPELAASPAPAALGAALAARAASGPVRAAVRRSRPFRPALRLEAPPGQLAVEVASRIVVDREGLEQETARGREGPAEAPDAAALAARAAAEQSTREGYEEKERRSASVLGRDGGIERTFELGSNWGRRVVVEQYLVAGGRAVVLSFPEELRPVALRAVLRPEWPAVQGAYLPPLTLPQPPGWTAKEMLLVDERYPGLATMRALNVIAPTAPSPEQWVDARIDAFLREHPGAAVIGREAGPAVAAIAGTVTHLAWIDSGMEWVGAVVSASSGEHLLSVQASVPRSRAELLPAILALVGVRASASSRWSQHPGVLRAEPVPTRRPGS